MLNLLGAPCTGNGRVPGECEPGRVLPGLVACLPGADVPRPPGPGQSDHPLLCGLTQAHQDSQGEHSGSSSVSTKPALHFFLKVVI